MSQDVAVQPCEREEIGLGAITSTSITVMPTGIDSAMTISVVGTDTTPNPSETITGIRNDITNPPLFTTSADSGGNIRFQSQHIVVGTPSDKIRFMSSGDATTFSPPTISPDRKTAVYTVTGGGVSVNITIVVQAGTIGQDEHSH